MRDIKKSLVGRGKTAARSSAILAAELKQRLINPTNILVNTFWFRDPWNFGDTLTSKLVPEFGLTPHYTAPSEAALVGVGSILHRIPRDFRGAVWGSGLISDRRHALPYAQFLAVRGNLSAERVGAPPSCATGDPGLLVSEFVSPIEKKWQLGIIPHKTHRLEEDLASLQLNYPKQVRVVDVRRDAWRVAREVSACSHILTSSLHGLVLADAYGIPAAWFTQEPSLVGGDFKFRDYDSNFGQVRRFKLESNRTLASILRSLPKARDFSRVEELQAGLVETLNSFRHGLVELEA